MRKNATLIRIEEASEDSKMQKLILLKNRHFYRNDLARSPRSAGFFLATEIPKLSLNASYGVFTRNFF
jgi:hypothetical protein